VRAASPPNPAVQRLSLYLRELEHLAARGVQNASSRQLAGLLNITAAQVRKDLGYFGQFGRRGVGYHVASLAAALRRILGTDRTWNVVVVGAGDLGRALLRYRGFAGRGFNLVAAFDVAAGKVGRKVAGVPVYALRKLPQVVRKHDVKLAVLTVPAAAAQQAAELLCEAGVTGILNFAPTALQTPDGVAVGLVDLAAHLEQLSFRAAQPG
jgi:redox-sensing transcriptional repressor